MVKLAPAWKTVPSNLNSVSLVLSFKLMQLRRERRRVAQFFGQSLDLTVALRQRIREFSVLVPDLISINLKDLDLIPKTFYALFQMIVMMLQTDTFVSQGLRLMPKRFQFRLRLFKRRFQVRRRVFRRIG